MQELIKQEQFELEVLDRLNTARLLGGIVFCGGTMLRLCYGLKRFSVDLDFWMASKTNAKSLFDKIKKCLVMSYDITDAADKFYTLLFEVRSKRYPRALKIEIRKGEKKMSVRRAIAFSRFGSTQVILNTVSLQDMMEAKINALIDRREIRDAFDIEFLVKRGIKPEAPAEKLEKAGKIIFSFAKNDYAVKLGSVLAAQDREYYSAENFKILLMAFGEESAGK